MAVDQTYTDPSTGGALDRNAGNTYPAAVYDLLLSNIKALAGSSGPARIYSASKGALPTDGFPITGHCMGALANDYHVEYGTIASIAGSGNSAITFSNAFGTGRTPYIVALPSAGVRIYCSAASNTGATLNNGDGDASGVVYWIAVGNDTNA